MADMTRLINRLAPPPDGESPVRHRSGVVDTVNGDGTVDVLVSGQLVESVAVLAGATAGTGDTVHLLVWDGDLLVLGARAT